jgi:hypothetical protein
MICVVIAKVLIRFDINILIETFHSLCIKIVHPNLRCALFRVVMLVITRCNRFNRALVSQRLLVFYNLVNIDWSGRFGVSITFLICVLLNDKLEARGILGESLRLVISCCHFLLDRA